MRQLSDTELFKLAVGQSEQAAIAGAIRNKLNQNIGDIAPEQIEPELIQLETKSKNSFYPLLPDALALYKNRGLVRLFNLGQVNGRTPIPVFMPFLAAPARNRVKESNAEIDAQAAQDRAIFVNMYRIGNWSADESTYDNLIPSTDLYSCLESGAIMYKLLVQNMSGKVFSSKPVVENLTKVYTNMFAQAMVRAKVPFGDDFNTDAANFLIAKFFLKYVLQKNNEDVVNSYAMLVTKNRTSLSAITSFEEMSSIDYGSLSSFLKTFGLCFYQEPVFILEFQNSWMKMYGEGTALAIEYVPYLIHDLFAAYHTSMLGGTIRIQAGRRIEDLKKIGLVKLYAAFISEIK